MKMKYFLKRTMITILVLTLLVTLSPQLLQPDNISIVEAAQTKMNYKKVTVKIGHTKTLKLKNASGTVKWKSKQKSIATVSKKGKVKGKKAGKATIIATCNGKNYKCTVTVKGPTAQSAGSPSEESTSTETPSTESPSVEYTPSTVYWTPSGSVYHISRNCPTLSRSRTVYSGSISSSGKSRACLVCS